MAEKPKCQEKCGDLAEFEVLFQDRDFNDNKPLILCESCKDVHVKSGAVADVSPLNISEAKRMGWV